MAAVEDYRGHIQALTYRNQAFVNGKFIDALSGKTFDCVSPIDGKVLTRVAECGKDEIDAAVKAARAAFEDGRWTKLAPRKRKQLMLKWVALVEKHREELALLETLDVGKPISDSRSVDVSSSIACLQWYAETCDKIYDELAPARPDSISMITREPIGVVGAVIPWNFPLMMASWKLGPALAAGNSVVLKPAEQSPLSALRLAELAAEAGIPPGVLNVVPGLGETAGQALGRHLDVDMIAFTGSTEVGKYFLRYAGESNMKHVALETGGKSPNIVFADVADLEHAAKTAAIGVFYNSGQVCTAATRLIVQEPIREQFLALVAKYAGEWMPGNPLNASTVMGSMVDEKQMMRVLTYIELGKVEGAKLAFGGKRALLKSGGFYVEPTIFEAVNNNMSIAQEEIFGPVLATIAFRDDEDAVRIANGSIYGLQASLWTRDITRAHRIARALRAGTVNINNTDGGDITAPFGGYKQSGMGRDKSLHALTKYQQIKHTYIQL